MLRQGCRRIGEHQSPEHMFVLGSEWPMSRQSRRAVRIARCEDVPDPGNVSVRPTCVVARRGMLKNVCYFQRMESDPLRIDAM